ncbi:hypothetical protein MP228_010562 [Amoeboaphelidium protococcarum]|nr:hypothetical protein MP228_010562 [Amoeboaphelidium protococcarum]
MSIYFGWLLGVYCYALCAAQVSGYYNDASGQLTFHHAVQSHPQRSLYIVKSRDRSDDSSYGILKSLALEVGFGVHLLGEKVAISGLTLQPEDVVLAVGSSSELIQRQLGSTSNSVLLSRFISLAYPITQLLPYSSIAIAPMVDATSRSLFSFAIQDQLLSQHKNVGHILVSNTSYSDMFSGSNLKLISAIKRVLQSQYDSNDDQDSVQVLRAIQKQLKRESHVALSPPCHYYNDKDPKSVDKNVNCFVGSQFMAYIQLQSAIGHLAPDLNESLSPIVHNLSGRFLGYEYHGALKNHPLDVSVSLREEQHYAWVHFPLHVPVVRKLSTSSVEAESVSETIYESSAFYKRSQQMSNSVQWPLKSLTAIESKGKLGSRELYMKPLNHSNQSYLDLMRNVGLPFEHLDYSQSYEELFDSAQAVREESVWIQQPVSGLSGNQKGFCARLNLIAIKEAFKLLQFDGVRYHKISVGKQQTAIAIEPILKSNSQNLALSELQQKILSGDLMLAVSYDLDTLWNIGPLWIWRQLSVRETSWPKGSSSNINGRRQLLRIIQSPVMMSPVNFFIKDAAGIHYCKVLHPSRVIEWLLYDQ